MKKLQKKKKANNEIIEKFASTHNTNTVDNKNSHNNKEDLSNEINMKKKVNKYSSKDNGPFVVFAKY